MYVLLAGRDLYRATPETRGLSIFVLDKGPTFSHKQGYIEDLFKLGSSPQHGFYQFMYQYLKHLSILKFSDVIFKSHVNYA